MFLGIALFMFSLLYAGISNIQQQEKIVAMALCTGAIALNCIGIGYQLKKHIDLPAQK